MSGLSSDIDAVVEGTARLSEEQALELYRRADLHDLGDWALAACRRLHPEPWRTYVIDRNINYTNICTAHCTFCAFRRGAGAADAYVLPFDDIARRIRELVAINGTQVLMQGGMNPDLPIEYYEDLLRAIKAEFPGIHIHAFSPPEFVEFERFFNMDARQIIRRFRAAGLDTIPGGGAEIFAPRVRRIIGPGKCSGDQWLRIMRIAHEEGMSTSATMLIGHIEFVRERIEHMSAIRDMQDYALALRRGDAREMRQRLAARRPEVFVDAEPPGAAAAGAAGSYIAFIHWPFQAGSTPLGRLRRWNADTDGPFDDSPDADIQRGRVLRPAGAVDYLRTLAVARLFLDNVPNLQASWVTMGPKIGQMALFYGANDMGSVMMEEQVVSATGTTHRLNEDEICRLIADAGWLPAQRDQYYRILRRKEDGEHADKNRRR